MVMGYPTTLPKVFNVDSEETLMGGYLLFKEISWMPEVE